MEEYLTPTYFIDSDHPSIREFARKAAGEGDTLTRAVRLYYAVRDEILYNPYRFTFDRELYRASSILEQGDGFCIQKAILLAAAARAEGIPCRPGYANVINHLTTKRLRELLRTDLFVFHGYDELYLNGKWVKATPAFNKSLCEKFGIRPLEFDGISDSIFHPLDLQGRRHMEYVHDYGPFADFPFQVMISESLKYYPHLREFMDAGVSGKEVGASDREFS